MTKFKALISVAKSTCAALIGVEYRGAKRLQPTQK